MLTVIIGVKNEEKNIADCLRSCEGVDQVFVVDSQSTDRTCDIAREMGTEVVQFEYDGGWPKKRNWALENLPIRNEWVLILDGDERLTPALKAEIELAIQDDSIDGYYIRWKFVFLKKWMKYSWSHGWMMRLFRHKKGAYEDLGMRGEGGWDNEVHENVVVQGKTGRLKSLLIHESNEDLFFWIKKQNEFSTWNAARRLQLLSDGMPSMSSLFSRDPVRKRKYMKAVFMRLPFSPLALFLYLYLVKLGFLDGRAGYYFCRLMANIEFILQSKMYEAKLSHASDRPDSK